MQGAETLRKPPVADLSVLLTWVVRQTVRRIPFALAHGDSSNTIQLLSMRAHDSLRIGSPKNPRNLAISTFLFLKQEQYRTELA